MRDQSDATTATDFPVRKSAGARRSRLVQAAPGPEQPDTRDKRGAQLGMTVILIGGGAFWAAVAAAVWLLS